MMLFISLVLLLFVNTGLGSYYRRICENRLDKPDICDEYCKLIEQVQACESSDEHHRISGCSGSDEQELHKRREKTKQLCMEILFPDEAKTLLNTDPQPASNENSNNANQQQNQQHANPLNANPTSPSPVPAAQLEPQMPLTSATQTDTSANEPRASPRLGPRETGVPPELNNAAPVPQPAAPSAEPTTLTPPPDAAPANSNPASSANPNANANANSNSAASQQQAAAASAAKKSASSTSRASSYTSNSMLLVSIVVILILHFVVYLLFVHNVVKNNTEQMSKMVVVLEELNVRLRRMNGEPDSDAIDEEAAEEAPSGGESAQPEPR